MNFDNTDDGDDDEDGGLNFDLMKPINQKRAAVKKPAGKKVRSGYDDNDDEEHEEGDGEIYYDLNQYMSNDKIDRPLDGETKDDDDDDRNPLFGNRYRAGKGTRAEENSGKRY